MQALEGRLRRGLKKFHSSEVQPLLRPSHTVQLIIEEIRHTVALKALRSAAASAQTSSRALLHAERFGRPRRGRIIEGNICFGRSSKRLRCTGKKDGPNVVEARLAWL